MTILGDTERELARGAEAAFKISEASENGQRIDKGDGKVADIAQAARMRKYIDDDYALSEDQLALEFAKTHPDWRWAQEWGKWLWWNGQVWEIDKTLALFSGVRKFLRAEAGAITEAGVIKGKESLKFGSAKTIASLERLCRSDRKYAATVDQWDQDPWLLNTPNGVVDLKTGNLLKHDKRLHMTKITAVGPEGDCPRWMKFLNEITDKDKELVSFLQRMAGYALTGITIEHSFCFFYGTGRNGKTTFLSALTGMLNDYATIAPIEVFTESHGERHPTEIAMLRGARLVVANETEEGRRWAESRMKQLTGGDPVSARFMRQDYFTYTPQFKLVIAGNHRPRLSNVDEAMRRRLNLVPFIKAIPIEDVDKNLSEKLKQEWPGILKWAIDGCLEYQKHGLSAPDCVQKATEEYFTASDVFQEWVEEHCELGADYWEIPTPLLKSWKKFCKEIGHPTTQLSFIEKLESNGIYRGRTGSSRQWNGIKLKRLPVSDTN